MAPKCIALWIESLGGPRRWPPPMPREKGIRNAQKPHRHIHAYLREIADLNLSGFAGIAFMGRWSSISKALKYGSGAWIRRSAPGRSRHRRDR
jgi:hypothetical protein